MTRQVKNFKDKYEKKAYYAWIDMRKRCRNKNRKDYVFYGGRGITICAEWDSFETFYKDMGLPPDGSSIDRIDNDGNYEPSNCKWATRKEQYRNRRSCVYVTINGITKIRKDWATDIGISEYGLRYRMQNWPQDKWTIPSDRSKNRHRE